MLCGDECERVNMVGVFNYESSIFADVAGKPGLSLDKSSFVLGNELWEEHSESLLALVKAYIIDI